MTSIRGRTALLVALSMAGVLCAGGAALYVVLSRALASQFDDALHARAAALQSLTHFDGTRVEVDMPGETMPGYARRTNAEYFVVWVREGAGWRVLERSASLTGADWPGASLIESLSGFGGAEGGPGRARAIVRDADLPDGRRGRAASARFVPTRDFEDTTPVIAGVVAPEARLLVAIPRAPLDRTLSLIGWSIAGVCAAMAMASVGAARWAVTRGLRELNDLSRRVRAIGPDMLGTRFDAAGLPAELRPIAEQLSGLLGRLEEAFEREKRFGAAASHELRTPIAELRSLLEVAASRPRTSEEWTRTADSALGVLARAQALCETLLRLSRAGAGRSVADAALRTDLGGLLGKQAARAASMHGREASCVRVECEPGLAARVEEAAIDSIVGNLLDNALRHGRVTADEPVVVRGTAQGGKVAVEVTNAGPDLGEADVAHMFEPFWRKDESRNDRRGFGLGLAVARTLARACGGELDAGLAAPGVLRMRLTLDSAA